MHLFYSLQKIETDNFSTSMAALLFQSSEKYLQIREQIDKLDLLWGSTLIITSKRLQFWFTFLLPYNLQMGKAMVPSDWGNDKENGGTGKKSKSVVSFLFFILLNIHVLGKFLPIFKNNSIVSGDKMLPKGTSCPVWLWHFILECIFSPNWWLNPFTLPTHTLNVTHAF